MDFRENAPFCFAPLTRPRPVSVEVSELRFAKRPYCQWHRSSAGSREDSCRSGLEGTNLCHWDQTISWLHQLLSQVYRRVFLHCSALGRAHWQEQALLLESRMPGCIQRFKESLDQHLYFACQMSPSRLRLVTDASNTAVACVLLQRDESEDWHPVAYTSRRLRVEERNYHANERETLAVIHALRVWRTYLFKPFQVVTDNQAVTYLLSKKQLSSRETRWLDLLADFDMTISHKPGRENIADAISRALLATPDPLLDESPASATLGSVIGEFCQEEETSRLLFEGYSNDTYFQSIISKLKEESHNSWKKRYFWSDDKGLFLMDESIWRLCIPKGTLRLKLLRMYHQSASTCHPGRERTYLRLRRYFYWPKLAKSVKSFVKSCDTCQRCKGDSPRPNPLQALPLPKRPWEDLSMDFITGLPSTANGNNAILTFVDRLTNYAHFVPTSTAITAAGTADLYIRNVYRLHGLSQTIVCDGDPRFTAEFFREVLKRLKTDLKLSTSQHPETDGHTERTHRTIGQILRSVVNHRQNNWEDVLPLCEFAYNDMTHGSTQSSPFFLNYGQSEFPMNADARDWLQEKQESLNIAKDCLQEAMIRQATNADRHRLERTFLENQEVLVHRDHIGVRGIEGQPCAKFRHRCICPLRFYKFYLLQLSNLNSLPVFALILSLVFLC